MYTHVPYDSVCRKHIQSGSRVIMSCSDIFVKYNYSCFNLFCIIYFQYDRNLTGTNLPCGPTQTTLSHPLSAHME